MSFKRYLDRGDYGVVVERDGDQIKSHRVQANRNAILNQNAELRKNKGAIRNMDGMRLALDIPIADMPMLNRFFPGIADPGHPDYKDAMRRFLKSPASQPYRVEENTKQKNAGHIWVR